MKLLRTLVTWGCVYPVITFLVYAINMLDLYLPVWQQTLVLTGVFVPMMVLFIAPKVNAVMNTLNTQKIL
jgi:antibiotic biosynthesis monooxygenase (ABM) superfamily enzyme